ncbi:DUF3833 domain-containing protein [Congregibacter brevis]|uniref:DUF3833 domain-containing protein n=1 Tax=Congregibacter brevis TaxID=3081201 RepID=A0ABZ0I7Z3_9GAMM|nr:DUF3833 domain-containing protein [Congregibacter sp. IMCC45268]
MPAIQRIVIFALISLLAACGSISVDDYAGTEPEFKPQSFFDGPLIARGVLKDRSGLVIRRFSADIKAYWTDGVGTLEEDFVFDDGEESRRVWTLTPSNDGGFIATAGDVVGKGRASVAGNAMFLDYVLRVPYGDGSIDLSIDDRMYLLTPNVLINESQMRKFGFRVGEIVLTIERLAPAA